jgi:hypothetical protein
LRGIFGDANAGKFGFIHKRLGINLLPGTNALAYYARALLQKEEKCFITFNPLAYACTSLTKGGKSFMTFNTLAYACASLTKGEKRFPFF